MAAISKSGTPSLASELPPQQSRLAGGLAGEAISAGDACRVHSDGTIMKSNGGAAGTADVHGFAAMDAAIGEGVSLCSEVTFRYGTGLTKGSKVYLSPSVAGGLDTATSTNVTKPCGYVLWDGKRIRLFATLQ